MAETSQVFLEEFYRCGLSDLLYVSNQLSRNSADLCDWEPFDISDKSSNFFDIDVH